VGAHRGGEEIAVVASVSGGTDMPSVAGGGQGVEEARRVARGLLEKERGGGGKAAMTGAACFL
jgi:hypothetical protein